MKAGENPMRFAWLLLLLAGIAGMAQGTYEFLMGSYGVPIVILIGFYGILISGTKGKDSASLYNTSSIAAIVMSLGFIGACVYRLRDGQAESLIPIEHVMICGFLFLTVGALGLIKNILITRAERGR